VGVVTPWPPVRSGIADYSSELLPELGRHFDVARYSPQQAGQALVGGHDVLLFQIGNDPLHAPSVEALAANGRRIPAVVVLHDHVLHHLFAAAYLDRGREIEYVRAMERAHGERGRALAERSIRGPRVPVWDLDPWAFPLSRGVALDATAVIVHSRLVRGAVLRDVPGARVVEIPHHVVPAPRTPPAEARRALGLPPARVLAVTLGIVTPAKRIDKLLEGLALLPPRERPFLFVGGAVAADDPLRRLAADLDLGADVAFGGYLAEDDFWKAASAADLAVNLRFPTMGETSGAVCRLAGFGLPVLVSDVGWFRELPESFATKIPVQGEEVERIADALRRLAADRQERERRSARAKAWGAMRSPRAVASAYASVLEEAARGASAPAALIGALAGELAAIGAGRPGPLGATCREPDAELLIEAASASDGILRAPSTRAV